MNNELMVQRLIEETVYEYFSHRSDTPAKIVLGDKEWAKWQLELTADSRAYFGAQELSAPNPNEIYLFNTAIPILSANEAGFILPYGILVLP